MLPLGQILQNSNVNYPRYADDTQTYLKLSPDDCSPMESLGSHLVPGAGVVDCGEPCAVGSLAVW